MNIRPGCTYRMKPLSKISTHKRHICAHTHICFYTAICLYMNEMLTKVMDLKCDKNLFFINCLN